MIKYGFFSLFIVIYGIGFAIGDASDIPSISGTCEPGSCTFLPHCPKDGCNILYRNMEDCYSYYRCCEGISQFHKCSVGLVFNGDQLTCDYAQNYDCADIVSNLPPETAQDFTSSTILTDPTSISKEISDYDVKVTKEKTEDVSTVIITEAESELTNINEVELTTKSDATDAEITEITDKPSSDFKETYTNADITVTKANTETDISLTDIQNTTYAIYEISNATLSNTTRRTTVSGRFSTLSSPALNSTSVETFTYFTVQHSESTESASTTTNESTVTTAETPTASIVSSTGSNTTSMLTSLNSIEQPFEYTTTMLISTATNKSTATMPTSTTTNKSTVTTAETSTASIVSSTGSNTTSMLTSLNSTEQSVESTTTMLISTATNKSTDTATTTSESYVTTVEIIISNFTTSSMSVLPITKSPTVCLEFNCPSKFGLYPDPKNCSRFFHCSHSVAYHKDCPANLHFNSVLDVCDWPYRAGCDKTKAMSMEFRDVSICANCSNCKIPDLYHCTRYIQCINGTAHSMRCPVGQKFDNESLKCMSPEHVKCKTTEIFCPQQEGLFPSTNCKKFVECLNGIPYERECPPGLHFNKKLLTCDWPTNSNCTDSAQKDMN